MGQQESKQEQKQQGTVMSSLTSFSNFADIRRAA